MIGYQNSPVKLGVINNLKSSMNCNGEKIPEIIEP